MQGRRFNTALVGEVADPTRKRNRLTKRASLPSSLGLTNQKENPSIMPGVLFFRR